MPREVEVVRPDGVAARVVQFQRRAKPQRQEREKTEDEIEWHTFKQRWARWKRKYDFDPPDPANLQVGFTG